MDNFLYATLKDPSQRNLRESVAERYHHLYSLTDYGKIPVRFKIKEDGRIRYDDKLANMANMNEVITRKKYVNIVPHKIKKQYLLPI